MKRVFNKCWILTTTFAFLSSGTVAQQYLLIAHRGGVVDSTRAENSRPALEAAIKQGYWMTEIDLRLTKDGVFVLQHEKTLKNFGVNKSVNSMSWSEINILRNIYGDKVQLLEDALRLCDGKMQIMIDNKIAGNDTIVFKRLLTMLKKYNRLDNALMIGTDESAEFFTGKIKLSCTRQQLEENTKKPRYSPSHYYLFGGTDSMNAADVLWAQQQNIMVVGVVNQFRYRNAKDAKASIADDVKALKSWGIKYFQIDSEFSALFRH